jgi:NO-binding membrane sensor protein with MHYT domain
VDQVHHFTYGWITPAFAFAMSFLGSLLGLISAARARASTNRRRRTWLLVLAAWAIGGTGIWVMHFMAMVGFSVPNSPLRYDVPVTAASFLIAVVTVGLGLFIVGYGTPSATKVLIGGPITGVSVAMMHYTGMAALHINGSFDYARNLVLASYAIAVVAATVALWFTVVVRGVPATVAAALVMALAVSSMHYTGMAAMHVHLSASYADVQGVDVNWFLAPIVLFVLIVVVALASAAIAVPSEREQGRLNLLGAAAHTQRIADLAAPAGPRGFTGETAGRREPFPPTGPVAPTGPVPAVDPVRSADPVRPGPAPAPGSRAARYANGASFAARAANGRADAQRQQPR